MTASELIAPAAATPETRGIRPSHSFDRALLKSAEIVKIALHRIIKDNYLSDVFDSPAFIKRVAL